MSPTPLADCGRCSGPASASVCCELPPTAQDSAAEPDARLMPERYLATARCGHPAAPRAGRRLRPRHVSRRSSAMRCWVTCSRWRAFATASASGFRSTSSTTAASPNRSRPPTVHRDAGLSAAPRLRPRLGRRSLIVGVPIVFTASPVGPSSGPIASACSRASVFSRSWRRRVLRHRSRSSDAASRAGSSRLRGAAMSRPRPCAAPRCRCSCCSLVGARAGRGRFVRRRRARPPADLTDVLQGARAADLRAPSAAPRDTEGERDECRRDAIDFCEARVRARVAGRPSAQRAPA